jgi:type IV pilus assembly protein PilV
MQLNRRRQSGFSLIEVMVALIVTSIGLLGLAKMESLALSSTSVASSRSLAAVQAASLAASMHANPGYWAAGLAPATIQVDATTSNNFSSASDCTTTGTGACTPDQMRQSDLKHWASALGAVLPGYAALITCSTTGFPVTCTVQINWTENAVAANASQTNLALTQPTYILFVQP